MEAYQTRFFTGRQVTIMFCALMAALVLLPGTVWAVQTFSNVAIYDPIADKTAAVDGAQRLQVSAAGTVNARPQAPTKPFAVVGLTSGSGTLRGPQAGGIALTSLTLRNNGSAAALVLLQRTKFCNGGTSSALRLVVNVAAGASEHVPFPSPLVIPPEAGCTVNLNYITSPATSFYVTAVGYDL